MKRRRRITVYAPQPRKFTRISQIGVELRSRGLGLGLEPEPVGLLGTPLFSLVRRESQASARDSRPMGPISMKSWNHET